MSHTLRINGSGQAIPAIHGNRRLAGHKRKTEDRAVLFRQIDRGRQSEQRQRQSGGYPVSGRQRDEVQRQAANEHTGRTHAIRGFGSARCASGRARITDSARPAVPACDFQACDDIATGKTVCHAPTTTAISSPTPGDSGGRVENRGRTENGDGAETDRDAERYDRSGCPRTACGC